MKLFLSPPISFVAVSESNPLSPSQTITLIQALQAAKESTRKTATDHRDLHSSVSKVGKAIDRNFVSDYDSTSRNDIFRYGHHPNLSLFSIRCFFQHFYGTSGCMYSRATRFRSF